MSVPTNRFDAVRINASRARSTGTNVIAVDSLATALRRLRDRFVLARQRRAAIAELSLLSDRQLEDIGVRREQIPETVEGILRRQSPVEE